MRTHLSLPVLLCGLLSAATLAAEPPPKTCEAALDAIGQPRMAMVVKEPERSVRSMWPAIEQALVLCPDGRPFVALAQVRGLCQFRQDLLPGTCDATPAGVTEDKPLAVLEEGLRRHPRDPWVTAAMLHFLRPKVDRARLTALLAGLDAATEPILLLRASEAWLLAGDVERAYATSRKLVELEPDSPAAYDALVAAAARRKPPIDKLDVLLTALTGSQRTCLTQEAEYQLPVPCHSEPAPVNLPAATCNLLAHQSLRQGIVDPALSLLVQCHGRGVSGKSASTALGRLKTARALVARDLDAAQRRAALQRWQPRPGVHPDDEEALKRLLK